MKLYRLFFTLLFLLPVVGCGGQDGNGGEPAFFSESFDTAGGWRTSSGPDVDIEVVDGSLSIEVKVLDRVAWSVAGRRFRDGSVSVDATPVGGPEDNAYGLVIRHKDDRSFYRFEISSDGYFAVQAPQGTVGWEFLADWTESPAIRRGQETNRLKVVCRGSSMIFSVNDVELVRVEDEGFGAGDVGVVAGTFYTEPGTHVHFDNFRTEPIDA